MTSYPSASGPLVFDQLVRGAVQLSHDGNCRGETLQAFVRGVPLGEPTTVTAGDSSIQVPTVRFPHVDFPAEIRISRADGTDAMAPVRIDSVQQVNLLVGEGTLDEVVVSLRQGLVVGTARNSTNGVGVPVLIGRINGVLLRTVETRITGPDERGGAVVQFTLPVEAGDISDRGATFEILQAPLLDCIWRTVLAPVDTLMAGGIVTDIRLSEAERKLAEASLALETRLGAQVARQNHLIEDVTAHLLALINDRGANNREQARQLIAGTHSASAHDGNAGVVGVLSPFMGWGWSHPELGLNRLEQRRMGAAATVLNPHPQRTVSAIAMTVTQAQDGALAALSAQLDGQTALVEPSKTGGAPCTVIIRPQPAASLSVLSLTCTAPGNGIAVQDFRFFYA